MTRKNARCSAVNVQIETLQKHWEMNSEKKVFKGPFQGFG